MKLPILSCQSGIFLKHEDDAAGFHGLHMLTLATIMLWICCSISLGTHDQILCMPLNVLHTTFSVKSITEFALKSIGFLKARHLRRIILDLSSNPKIDCNPDAYFAGMNGNEKITYLACMKSRTGYIINVGNCPVLWQSKF